jgi:glycosyltransferase involved in cell wall biosynthesis
LVKKIKPDILHAHQVVPFGLYGALSGFHPFVVSPWGSDVAEFPEKSKIHRFLGEYVLKKADAVSAGDEIVESRLMKLKCSKEKIVPLRISSVDTDMFHPSKRSEALIKAIGAENEFLVLNARPLTPSYHVDVFIRAIPFVIREIPNVKFIILLGRGSERHRLEELAQKLDVNDGVLWMQGVPHSKMPEYLATTDIYVDTFVNIVNNKAIDKGNGIGVTTLEAMACATPQILPDRIEVTSGDLYQGITYRPLDYQDLADKIIELLQNEQLRKEIGDKSRNAAIKIVDENVVMRKWEELYFNLQKN